MNNAPRKSYFMDNFSGEMVGIKKRVYKELLKRCKKNKSNSTKYNLFSQLWGNERHKQKIYMDNEENLYTINWGEYTILTNGELECINCGFYDSEDMKYHKEDEDTLVCKSCYLDCEIEVFKKQWKIEQQKKATLQISNWFLECKYNPKYKYCKDRLNKLYDEEFN